MDLQHQIDDKKSGSFDANDIYCGRFSDWRNFGSKQQHYRGNAHWHVHIETGRASEMQEFIKMMDGVIEEFLFELSAPKVPARAGCVPWSYHSLVGYQFYALFLL